MGSESDLHALSYPFDQIINLVWNIPGEGGELTLYLIGKLSRPSKEPLYSEGDRNEFPIDPEYAKVSYLDYISSHLKNTDKFLISQNLCNKKFSGIFVKREEQNATAWAIQSTYKDFSDYVDKQWKKGNRLYSLACDESLGFGCYCLNDYGDSQSILIGTSRIVEYWDKGKVPQQCSIGFSGPV